MKKSVIVYTIVLVFTLTFGIDIYVRILDSTPVYANTFTPSHSCSKPFKPYSFDDQREYDQFLAEVERYKACIDDFVEEQQDAIRKHQNAAEEAIDDWNNFVRWELQ